VTSARFGMAALVFLCLLTRGAWAGEETRPTPGEILLKGLKPGQEGTLKRSEILVLGRVSQGPTKHYPGMVPLAEYAASRMRDLGIRRGGVLLARDNAELVRYLKEGKVDWVSETPFSALYYQEAAGGDVLLLRWKKGVARYRTVFFTKKDSGIHSLDDLRGRVLAFNDLGSTTSFLFPVAILKQKEIGLVRLKSRGDRPPPDQVGYLFTHGDEVTVSTWVHRGLADAGAFSDLDWNSEQTTPTSFRDNFKIIYQSPLIPRALEITRKDLDPRIRDRLKQILLHLHEDPQAASMLEDYSRTLKFDRVDKNMAKELDNLREWYQRVRMEVAVPAE